MTKKSKVVIFSTVFIALIICILIGGHFYFMDRMLPNTKYYGENISFMEYSKIPDLIEDQSFKIIGQEDKVMEITGSQLGFTEVFEGLEEMQNKRGFWLFEAFEEKNLEDLLVRKVDDEKLREEFMNSIFLEDMEEPENSRIEIREDEIELIPEKMGSTLLIDENLEDIKETYKNGKLEVELAHYKKPEITVEDLQETYDNLEEYMAMELKIDIKGKEENIPKASRFLVYQEEEEDYSFDIDAIRDYVMELKQKVDNIGKTREFTTFYGTEIEVSGGIFGVRMNRDKTANKILEAFLGKENKVIEPEYTSMAINYGEIGDDYIELSLADQRMWLVRGGEVLVDTPVVTGNVSEGYATPKGVFEVWIKETDRYLRGTNFDGSKYKVPVDYWMQVDYTGIGLHDTYYRSSYGGNIYYNDGSHGCINTPYNNIKAIYENTELGTPMVIY